MVGYVSSRRIDQVTRALEAMGAGWAGEPKKILLETDATPLYHIYPDRNCPHPDQMLRFSSLRKLGQWIVLRQQGMHGLLDPDDYQAAIQHLVGRSKVSDSPKFSGPHHRLPARSRAPPTFIGASCSYATKSH